MNPREILSPHFSIFTQFEFELRLTDKLRISPEIIFQVILKTSISKVGPIRVRAHLKYLSLVLSTCAKTY